MSRTEILEKVTEVCRDVFENDTLVVTEATTAKDVEEWDSLTHLTLVNELEELFGIAFSLDEVTNSKNLGELISAIEKHLGEK